MVSPDRQTTDGIARRQVPALQCWPMQRYDGHLVHRTQDELGPIEVVEDTLYRSLHFGTEPKQSSMLLGDPLALVLSYTRSMTTALLFVPQVRRVLLIGLGGGSLAKFILHHIPGCA